LIHTVSHQALTWYSRGWTYSFFLFAGVSLIPLVIAIIAVPRNSGHEEHPTRDKRIDWLGAVLITAAMVLLLFCLAESGETPAGWRTPCRSSAQIEETDAPLTLSRHTGTFCRLCAIHRGLPVVGALSRASYIVPARRQVLSVHQIWVQGNRRLPLRLRRGRQRQRPGVSVDTLVSGREGHDGPRECHTHASGKRIWVPSSRMSLTVCCRPRG
jgi:hypothetical protein